MPRFIPPHLFLLVCLLVFVIWVMLVHRFRRSPAVQHFFAETFGDNTPEYALRAYELARRRLIDQLDNRELDHEMRNRIKQALGIPPDSEPIDSLTDDRSFS